MKVFCIIKSICTIGSLGWVPDVEGCTVPASHGASCSSAWAVLLVGSTGWSSTWVSVCHWLCGFLGLSTLIGCTPCNWHLPQWVTQIQVLQHIWHHVDEWVVFNETSSNTLPMYFSAGAGWNWHQDCVDCCNDEIIAVQLRWMGWLVQNSKN